MTQLCVEIPDGITEELNDMIDRLGQYRPAGLDLATAVEEALLDWLAEQRIELLIGDAIAEGAADGTVLVGVRAGGRR